LEVYRNSCKMKIRDFLSLTFVLSFLPNGSSVCHSHATRCQAVVGLPLVPDESTTNDVFDVPGTDALYFTYSQPESVEGTRVLASLMYGNIDIYAAVGRKPTITDFDFRTDAIQDVLMIPTTAAESEIEVMVVAITNTKLRVMVGAHSVASQLTLGSPQLDCLMVVSGMPDMSTTQVTHTYHFKPLTTSKLYVTITPFAETDPNLVVTGPEYSGGPPRTWTGSDFGADTVVIDPVAADVGLEFTIKVSVSPLFNQTQFTLVVTESSTEHPTTLLGGIPLEFYALKDDEMYFVLDVPKSSADITFMATPIYGDPDIYVNPGAKGFYVTPADVKDKVPAIWDSDHSFGVDSVLVDHNDPEFVKDGNNIQYFVTIRVREDTRFAVRAYSAATIMTLTAGTPVVDKVSDMSYHYYRFVEAADSTQDVIFDVSPLEGDPDLLVGCHIVPFFNISGYPSNRIHHHNYSSAGMGEDSILISGSPSNRKKCPGGVYYLAVFGFHATRFSLTAIHQGGVVKLQDGVTIRSTSYPNIGRLFSFRMGVEPEEVSITLTPFNADCDLFVKMNNQEATRFNSDYRSMLGGLVSDEVIIPETEVCTKCDISVFVWGREKCSFSLVVSLEDTTIQLSEAMPMEESVAYNAIQYYTLLSSDNGTATAVLTVLSGVPELYISTRVDKPTATSEFTTVCKAASVGGLPVAHVPISEGETLYIGVGGSGTNASYTVRAHVRKPTYEPLLHLLAAVPQADEMKDGGPDWIYYQVNAPIGHESIVLRATAFVGDIDVYVQHCPFQGAKCYGNQVYSEASTAEATSVTLSKSYFPNRTFYSETTFGLGKDFITIDRNDDTLTSYIIGVVSNSMNTEYQISMSLKNSILVLTPGHPVTDFTSRGEYDYFSTHVDKSGEIITFDVTPFSGDVDLYVSTSADVVNDNVNGHPNETFYTWRSMMFGEDTISVDTELDPKACLDCVYYLSVYGYTDSEYTVSVSTESTIGRLLDGVPLQGSVAFLGSTKYSFKNTYGIGRDFKVRLNVFSGSPTAYITFDGTVPSLTNYALASPLFSSNSFTIDIKHTEEYYEPCNSGECNIRIAVIGVLASSYSITITSSMSNTMLQMDVPVTAAVGQHQYDYFKTTVPSHNSNLRLTLTEYSGYAMMYVSCKHSYPNGSRVGIDEWEFYPYETEHFDITALEATEKNCPRSGTFYVSVYGDSSCSYSLMASLITNTSIPRLYAGISMTKSVKFHEFNYYYYSPPTDFSQNLNILVTANRGDVDVFVSASWADRPYYSELTGAPVSFAMRSAITGSGNIAIKHTELEELCIQNAAKDRSAHRFNAEDCYIIVGVFGAYDSDDSESSYRIEVSTQDSTTTLRSGVAIRSNLYQQTIDYYKYTVTTPDVDIVVSITPFYGDPDMFMAFSPVTHPNPDNYTWMAANYGADTLNIQADEIKNHCIPVPDEGKHCDFFIGVYAWRNTSYSIVARMEEGIKHPVVLSDGQPQSGSVDTGFYSYYSFYIKARQGENPEILETVTISVTGEDGSDEDIYMVFGTDNEPGKNHFDRMSANYAGLVDQISISSTDENFCRDCTILIGVYGYRGGSFSIVATADGVTELMSGTAVAGHIEKNTYKYYSFHNTDPDAQINIALTAISGDPDLFMNVYHPSTPEVKYKYPTMLDHTWLSINAGNDAIALNYADQNFCYDCSYIVGVYSYHNATYTLMMTDTDEAVISLSRNRPQHVSMLQDGMRYFTASSASSTEDITVSVTTLGSGTVKIYMQKYLAATFDAETMKPNPIDPTSFAYSNIHNKQDFVHAPGPNTEDMVYVILVTAASAVSYDVVLTSSDTPLLLRAGLPQSHFVKKHTMEYFKFPMAKLTDLQVSISATSGDPDLFISLGDFYPQCNVFSRTFSIHCKNWTWSSTTYATDQVIISQDYPCLAVMPGTYVTGDCSAKDFHAGEVHIGVYGYTDSKFHVMVTPRGQHIQLLPGHRQLAYTAPGFLCSDRTENGACSTSSGGDGNDVVAVEVAYFKFEFSGSVNSQSVLFTVVPTCSVMRNASAPCQPGCDCALLEMVIDSCPSSLCTTENRFPSPLNSKGNKAFSQVAREGTSILVDDKSKVHCTTSADGHDVCVYYLAVVSHQVTQSVAFTVDAETSSDLSVVACQATPSPDGMRVTRSATMSSSHNDAKYFELCSGAGSSESSSQERMMVTLEECYGSAEMYACSDASSGDVCDNFLPSESSWDYYANDHETCDHSSHGRKSCTNNEDTVSTNIPTFDFPEKNGNYYVKVNGTGQFNLNVQNTINGDIMSPRLMFDSSDQHGQDAVNIVVNAKRNEVALSWKHTQVLMPGAERYSHTPHMTYSLYIFPQTETKLSKNFIFDTPCGLEYSVKKLKGYIRPVEVHGGADTDIQYTLDISEFPSKANIVLVVVATCNSECLRQVSKVTPKASMTCNDEVGCKTQHLLYQSMSFTTGKGGSSSPGGDDEGSWFTYMFFVSILVITAVSATLFGVFSFYCKNKQTLDDLQALEMTDFGGEGDNEVPSNIKVSSEISSFFSMSRGGGRPATSRGPSAGGDGFFDHVMNGLSSVGGVLSSLTASASPSSAGSFTALESSSSHSTSGSAENSAYDPPAIATGGQSLLGKISSYSTSGKDVNYEEEDDDEVTISL